jgi:hypothetical protein
LDRFTISNNIESTELQKTIAKLVHRGKTTDSVKTLVNILSAELNNLDVAQYVGSEEAGDMIRSLAKILVRY